MLIQALGLVCALGAVTMATVAASGRYPVLAAFGTGFVALSLWTRLEGVPGPAPIGILVTVVVLLQLARPGFFPLTGFASGVLSGFGVPILQAQGVAVVPAFLMALGLPLLAILLALRRPMFAPLPLFEDALLMVLALGLIVAAAPAVASGWQAARVMNLEYEAAAEETLAAWVPALGVLALLLGGGHALWWRHR